MFGPKDIKEQEIFAIERLRTNAQFAFNCALKQIANENSKDVSSTIKSAIKTASFPKEVFKDNWNPNLVQLAKLANSLGYDITIELRSKNEKD